MTEREDYFDFVVNVLGVKSIFLTDDLAGSAHIPLLLAVENYNTYTAAETELLEKMVSALKINPELIKVLDLKAAAAFTSDFQVSFFDQPPLNPPTTANLLELHSPRALLKDASLKKQVWNELQKVIKHFTAMQ